MKTVAPTRSTMLLESLKSRLQAVYGDQLRRVVLYGSEARGEATAESDVDILVILAGPVSFGRDLQTIVQALYPLQLELERPLEAIPVDEGRYLSGDYAFFRNVQKEGLAA